VLTNDALAALHRRERLVDRKLPTFQTAFRSASDLVGFGPDSSSGYRGQRHTGVIDDGSRRQLRHRGILGAHRARHDRSRHSLIRTSSTSWHPRRPSRCRPITPPKWFVGSLVGEFRVHYAGFFDPGFGTRAPGGEAPARCWRCGPRGAVHYRARSDRRRAWSTNTCWRGPMPSMAAASVRITRAQGLSCPKHFRG